MHSFRQAIEARDIDAALALLSDDVVFHSPIVFAPYHGRPAVAPILHAIARVFEDFRYVREIGAPAALDHALVFRTRVGLIEIEGSDFLHHDGAGAVDELTVMIRPMTAGPALAEAMRTQLAALHGAAGS